MATRSWFEAGEVIALMEHDGPDRYAVHGRRMGDESGRTVRRCSQSSGTADCAERLVHNQPPAVREPVELLTSTTIMAHG
jgi:hypothetical protein